MPTDPKPTDAAMRRLLSEIAAAESAEIVEQARAGARVRARTLLEDALVEEILSAAASTRQRSQEGSLPTGAASQPRAEDPGDAWWAYCVLRADEPRESFAEIRGVEPNRFVETVAAGPLAALVSRVPLTEYGEERLREHLEDIDWLERVARAHEAVLEQAMGAAKIVPLRLCTLYRDQDGVRNALRENAQPLLENLSALDGCTERGVKVFLRARARSAPAAVPEPSTGTDYLAGRREERRRAGELEQLAATCSEEVHRTVTRLTRLERLNPVQRPEAHGRDAEMILNGAYLVEEGRLDELRSAIATLQERWDPDGFSVELTGPWPPYNFVSESAGMIT